MRGNIKNPTGMLGKRYTTHLHGIEGTVIRAVPNPSGTIRVLLITGKSPKRGVPAPTRWSTHIPEGVTL